MNNQATVRPLFRLLPSLTDVAFLMPVGMLFIVLNGARTMLGDGDTGWHIRTGEWILENGRVPVSDIFSYTKPEQPWFAWEWGWDVIFGWLHFHWGMEAVVIASILTLCVTFALLYRLAAWRSGNALVAIAITFVAMCASSIHWLARPHLFTLLFVVVFLSILEHARQGRLRLLFYLPLITVLWTNLHGGFFVGVVMAGSYAAGEWIAAALAERGTQRTHLRRSSPYLITAFACLAASLVNPYGYALHMHIVEYLSDPYHREHISEFMSTSFQPTSSRLFELLLLLGVLTSAWKVRRREYASGLLLLTWAHLALFAGRNIPIYAVISAAWIGEYLHYVWSLGQQAPAWLTRVRDEWLRIAQEVGSVDRIGRVHLVSLATIAGVSAMICAPEATGQWRAEYDPGKYPKAALAVVASFDPERGVFTDDEWGDYLAYSLYPVARVFVDGRSDFYGAEFSKKFLSVMEVRHDWQQTLDEYDVRTVLLPVRSPLASTLKESKHWRVVHDDGIAVVFRPAGDPSEIRGRVAFASTDIHRDRAIAKPFTVISGSPNSF